MEQLGSIDLPFDECSVDAALVSDDVHRQVSCRTDGVPVDHDDETRHGQATGLEGTKGDPPGGGSARSHDAIPQRLELDSAARFGHELELG